MLNIVRSISKSSRTSQFLSLDEIIKTWINELDFESESKKHKNAGKGLIKTKLETEQQTF